MLAIVLYLNQTTDREGHDRMVRVTREVIDLSTRHRGRFFLPYQLHYSREQLERAYPEIGAFFAARREFDPQGLFTNTLAERFDGVRPRGQTWGSDPWLVSVAKAEPGEHAIRREIGRTVVRLEVAVPDVDVASRADREGHAGAHFREKAVLAVEVEELGQSKVHHAGAREDVRPDDGITRQHELDAAREVIRVPEARRHLFLPATRQVDLHVPVDGLAKVRPKGQLGLLRILRRVLAGRRADLKQAVVLPVRLREGVRRTCRHRHPTATPHNIVRITHCPLLNPFVDHLPITWHEASLQEQCPECARSMLGEAAVLLR